MREFKRSPIFTKDISGRTVVGICAVFGNVDDIADRIHPGAFRKTIDESQGRVRAKHLWNHDFSSPPIASIKRLAEVGRDALPSEVLDYAPGATGGLEVGREYYKGVPLSDWVFAAIAAGDVTEMSFGFDAKKFDWTEEGEGAQTVRVRELRELMLYDTSDVLWGMNAATVADGKNLPLELVAANLAAFVSAARSGKAGRRNATSDLALINAIHRASVDLGCTDCAGVADPSDESGKAGQAGTDGKTIIPLSELRSKLDLLQLATLQ